MIALLGYYLYYFFVAEIPYLRINGNSFLLLPVGSRPLIEFVLAVDSDGVEELRSNVTELLIFTFSNSTQQQMVLPLPTMTLVNIQRYHYVVPPVGISTEGNYTLAINGMNVTFMYARKSLIQQNRCDVSYMLCIFCL